MKMTHHRVELPLAHTFTIARESLEHQSSLIVELAHEGFRGFGEVTENRFYGHTLDSITESLDRVVGWLDRYLDHSPAELWPDFFSRMNGDTFAISALDMAAYDLQGKRRQLPTWKDLGLQWKNLPKSSYTIGIDSIDKMVAKLHEQPGWSIYKIKLGTPHDLQIVSELRKHTDAVFRVDANCGWTSEQAVTLSKSLADLGVEFIEQPLRIEASQDEKRSVFENSALPIIADEDCQMMADVARCHELYHGVNVKICKCGGLTPAYTMLQQARGFGMKTMVGCMIESSVGISGAAQLLPLLDYADLDGAVLLGDDPATGVKVVKGEVQLADELGTGASLLDDRLTCFAPT